MAKAWSWYFGENQSVADAAAGAAPAKIDDEWWEKIVKGVPAEVVGAYTAIISFLKIPGGIVPLFVGFALGLAGTLVAMTMLRGLAWSDSDKARQRIARIQIVVALLAFAVWAYAQGGFFALWNVTLGAGDSAQVYTVYQDWVAGVLVVVMGFVLLVSDKITQPK